MDIIKRLHGMMPGECELIRKKLTKPAMYEGLAEEAAELAQAALKYARICRGENPTPVSLREARDHVLEEYTDVFHIASYIIGIKPDEGQIVRKNGRWLARLRVGRKP